MNKLKVLILCSFLGAFGACTKAHEGKIPAPARNEKKAAKAQAAIDHPGKPVTLANELSPSGFNWNHYEFAKIYSTLAYEDSQLMGYLNLQSIKKNESPLKKYLASLKKIKREEYERWPQKHKTPFILNSYLAHRLMIMVLANGIPDKKLLEETKFIMFQKLYTLDQFAEEEALSFKEIPEIIFSVPCFGKFCPQVRNRICNHKNVRDQIKVNVTRYLLNATYTTIDEESKNIQLSPLVKEYRTPLEARFGSLEAFLRLYYVGTKWETWVKSTKFKITFSE